MKLYGLYSKKKNCFLGFSTSSNSGGEFCFEVAFELYTFYKGGNLWVTNNKAIAEEVTKGSTPWYNATYDIPEWDEKYYGELEVVCLNDYELGV